MDNIDIKKLKSSWTKFDIVKLIDIISENDLQAYVKKQKGIDEPVLRNFLGIEKISDQIPAFWNEIQNHPSEIRLFSLFAAITTHYQIINQFAKFSIKGHFSGTFLYEGESNKQSTNIRSALVVAGASLQNYRREKKVPYNFTTIFENGDVGKLVKDLFKKRLQVIGYDLNELDNESKFIEACNKANIIDAIALTTEQFTKWLNGEALNVETDVFTIDKLKIYSRTPMLRVNQWMNGWDDIDFNILENRRKPKPRFYMFSMDARLLKRLSDVHRRNVNDREAIQRKKSDARVNEITNYIEGGFPWSTLSKDQQKTNENSKLKMPGLLPTAIIVNILSPDTKRSGKVLAQEDALVIEDKLDNDDVWQHGKISSFPTLRIPDHVFENGWDPELKPIEIIDGQHRLWAFDDNQNFNGDYELPVIAFDNLDKAWQAYLFYTINIKPVKINTSLGFDLYPMLRTQKWLENTRDGVLAYRESRAQEIVEILWSYSNSSWYNRINMLGEAGGAVISQAAFVRSLINSFFRPTKGLYSSNLVKNEPQVLNWNRTQQSAFITFIWNKIFEKLKINNELLWAEKLRDADDNFSEEYDPSYQGKETFLNRDQAIRPIMMFINDFFFTLMDESILNLNSIKWEGEPEDRIIDLENVDIALEQFYSNAVLNEYIDNIANIIISIDWRTPSAPFDSEDERRNQLIYKGSGGYAEYYKLIKDSILRLGNEKASFIINKMS